MVMVVILIIGVVIVGFLLSVGSYGCILVLLIILVFVFGLFWVFSFVLFELILID